MTTKLRKKQIDHKINKEILTIKRDRLLANAGTLASEFTDICYSNKHSKERINKATKLLLETYSVFFRAINITIDEQKGGE